MQTKRYTSHSIMNTDGKYIIERKITEALMGAIHMGKESIEYDGHKLTIVKDVIKDGRRITTVEVKPVDEAELTDEELKDIADEERFEYKRGN